MAVASPTPPAHQALGGGLDPGAALRVRLNAVQLGNRGDTLMLIDPDGKVVDKVAYQADEVRPGRTVAFDDSESAWSIPMVHRLNPSSWK